VNDRTPSRVAEPDVVVVVPPASVLDESPDRVTTITAMMARG